MSKTSVPVPDLQHDELQFSNYEVLQINSTSDNGETVWFYSKPNEYFQAHIDETKIEFRQLAEDRETDFIVENDGYYKSFVKQHSVLLGRYSFSRAVKLINGDEWVWHAYSVAQPDIVNQLADEIFTENGAHMLPLVLQQPDRENGRFTSMAWARALSAGYIALSTHPLYFFHDMHAHAENLRAIDMTTMSALQAIASLAVSLLEEDPDDARILANSLGHALDYYSFGKNFTDQLVLPEDPMFEAVLSGYGEEYTDDTDENLRDILTGFGFKVNVDTVERPKEVLAYNKALHFALED